MCSPRPSKRQRICRACDQCRRRKSKCDGEQPVCRICQAAGRNCSYENGGGRRGLPTGYVRGLETALGLVFQHIPSSEKELLDLLRERPNATSRNRAVERWRKSKVAPVLSQASPAGLGYLSTEEHIDEDAGWMVDEKHNDPTEQGPAGGPTPGRKEESIPQQNLHSRTESQEDIDLTLPSHTADLLDIYFIHTHSWFPILERRDLLRAMYTYPRERTRHSPCHFVLWAVIAYVTSINGVSNSSTIEPREVSFSIQRRILSNTMTVDLDHVRALVVLVLLHLEVGDIHLSWVLVGQAARMIALLPDSSQTGRFRNTFHGCVFLDNVISGLLGRAPSLSTEEQLICGPVDEDDMEEWDSWSISSSMAGRGPLQSLSTFNRLRDLTQVLSSILYHSTHREAAHLYLRNIVENNKAVLASHPYTGRDAATPPLLTLHLASAFVILTAIRHFKISDPARLAEISYYLLDILSDYAEVTASSRPLPLLRCFALQCQYCLEAQPQSPEIVALSSRISTYLEGISGPQVAASKKPPEDAMLHASADINGNTPGNIAILNSGNIQFPGTGTYPQETNVNTIQMSYATPISNIENINTPDKANVPPSLGEADGFDALFEELVTSIPSARLEPEFAHNLGFYAGDLDTEFMSQLQRSPNG